MLKVIKTAAMTTLAALSLTATLGTTANANGFNNNSRVSQSNNDQVLGGLIGVVAGGAIGSQIAGRGARTEGAIIGALLGGVAGANIADNRRGSSFNRGFSRNRSFDRQFSSNRFGNSGFRSNRFSGRHGSGFSSRQGFGRSLGSNRVYRNSGLISGRF